jgi:hypothetical protein
MVPNSNRIGEMLSLHPSLNPAVASAAELFTDGQVTDAILRGVASMRGLPLLIEAGAAPDRAEILAQAEAAMGGALANLHICRRLFVAACKRLGAANRLPADQRRAAQGKALGALNRARAELVRAERREAAARAALLALAS